jgi:hypothetical protein
MANSGEHRMLFDLRGRRKRLVQVVYALLAFIMAASLFFVVGPVDLTSLLGGGGTSSGNSAFEDEAQQLEHKLAKDPNNADLLARDVKARYSLAISETQTDPSTGQTSLTEDAVSDYNRAGEAWRRYVKVVDGKPNPNVANLAAKALTSTVTTGSSVTEIQSNLDAAVGAAKVVAEAKPSLGSYATLSQLAYFAGDTKTADAAAQKALKEAPSSQRTAAKQQIDQYKSAGAQFQKQVKAAAKAAKSQPGGGKQALQNPVGGLSGGGLGSGSP